MCTKKANSSFDAFRLQKCPRCRRGKMFTHSVFSISKFQEMHKHCPVCGVNFEPETGFYWGAMYISYAITVAISVAIGLTIRILFGPDLNINIYIFSIIGAILLAVPFSFRLSRAILLSFLARIEYDPEFKWDGQELEDNEHID